jgi:hypothetical protein
MQNAMNQDLERFKSELEIQRFQFEKRFSIIHERRAEILGEIYSLVNTAQRALSDLICPLQWFDGRSITDKKLVAQSAGKNMSDYYSSKMIYLDEELCSAIEDLIKLMHEAWIAFDTAQSDEPNEPNDRSLQDAAWKKISEKLPVLKRELEKRFRQELGPSC